MNKGLRRDGNVLGHQVVGRFQTCPDEQGIKTHTEMRAEVGVRWKFQTCPDEQGIKTFKGDSKPERSTLFQTCPDEQGIKTRRLRRRYTTLARVPNVP